MNCVICNASDIVLAYSKVEDLEYLSYEPVDYYKCSNCGLIFQEPLPTLSSLVKFYPDNYRNHMPAKGGGLFAFLKKKKFQQQARRLVKNIKANSRILEIGYGNGELLKALSSLGFKDLYGCDFSSKNYDLLSSLGIQIEIANVESSIPFEENFDLIILNNVIEHFLDPISVLTNCYSRLNHGGKIIILTPNADAFELDIFGKYWAGFHAPRHTYIFNQKNLDILAAQLGFRELRFSCESDPGQWAISVQNFYQSLSMTKTKLVNGMAFYTVFFALLFLPFSYLQNLLKRPTSLFVLLIK